MAQYTADFLASARHGYENTDQPMRELARELGIGITTLSTLAEKHGWAKRSLRKRGVPPALQLLAEAQALAAKRSEPAPTDAQQQPQAGLGPGFRGDERSKIPLAAPEPADLLIRLEQILAQLIAAQELAPGNGIHSPQSARTLTLLIQAMRALKGMRGDASTDTARIENDDDDMPHDLDEFRHALARRIEALFADEIDAAHAGEDSGCDAGAAE